jgi:hypothetical protein
VGSDKAEILRRSVNRCLMMARKVVEHDNWRRSSSMHVCRWEKLNANARTDYVRQWAPEGSSSSSSSWAKKSSSIVDHGARVERILSLASKIIYWCLQNPLALSRWWLCRILPLPSFSLTPSPCHGCRGDQQAGGHHGQRPFCSPALCASSSLTKLLFLFFCLGRRRSGEHHAGPKRQCH